MKSADKEKDITFDSKLLDAVFRSIPLGVGIVKNRVFHEVNDFFCALVGYSREELLGQSARLVYPDDQEYERVGRIKYKQIKKVGVGSIETRLRRKDGSIFNVYISSGAIDRKSLDNGVSFAALDLAELEQLKLADAVFENSAEGILITDPDGTIQRVNPAFTRITGYSSDEVIGRNPRLLKSDHHNHVFYRNMWRSLIEKGGWAGEIWNRRKNGESYPEHLTITAMEDEHKKIKHYIAVFYDVSSIKENEKQLKYQDNHDALTGLVNRKLCMEQLELQLRHASIHCEGLAVICIDLDNFKDINDSLGHFSGDQLLRKVADRLTRCCRNQDIVARMGGDEFMLLLPDLNHGIEDVLEIKDRIITELCRPYTLGEYSFEITVSIGISLFPEDASTADELIKNGTMAMARAKERGKARFVLFTESVSQEVQRRIMLEREMPVALKENKFQLYYQPKASLVDGTITGFEALIRWCKNDGEFVSPEEFIPLAERTGFILKLSEWILATACRQLKTWHEQGCRHLTMAVNLSAQEFEDADLVRLVGDTLRRYDLKAQYLQLEITEHTLMESIDSCIEVMQQLAEMGVSISLDDFGTGFSSLAYLKKFPITTLKVDRTFVKDVPDDIGDVAIIRVVHSLSRALGLTMVAEGVETKEQLELLQEIGCDEMQGYFCSRPLPPEEVSFFLDQNCPYRAVMERQANIDN